MIILVNQFPGPRSTGTEPEPRRGTKIARNPPLLATPFFPRRLSVVCPVFVPKTNDATDKEDDYETCHETMDREGANLDQSREIGKSCGKAVYLIAYKSYKNIRFREKTRIHLSPVTGVGIIIAAKREVSHDVICVADETFHSDGRGAIWRMYVKKSVMGVTFKNVEAPAVENVFGSYGSGTSGQLRSTSQEQRPGPWSVSRRTRALVLRDITTSSPPRDRPPDVLLLLKTTPATLTALATSAVN